MGQTKQYSSNFLWNFEWMYSKQYCTKLWNIISTILPLTDTRKSPFLRPTSTVNVAVLSSSAKNRPAPLALGRPPSSTVWVNGQPGIEKVVTHLITEEQFRSAYTGQTFTFYRVSERAGWDREQLNGWVEEVLFH